MDDLQLHGLIGGVGKSIKSIQRGSGSIIRLNTSITVAIQPVDRTKAVIIIDDHFHRSPNYTKVKAEWVDDQTIKFTRQASYNNDNWNANFEYYVMEFSSLKNLQRGSFIAGREGTISIDEIDDVSRVLLLYSYSSDYSDNYIHTVHLKLLNSNTLSYDTKETVNDYVNWEIVEF